VVSGAKWFLLGFLAGALAVYLVLNLNLFSGLWSMEPGGNRLGPWEISVIDYHVVGDMVVVRYRLYNTADKSVSTSTLLAVLVTDTNNTYTENWLSRELPDLVAPKTSVVVKAEFTIRPCEEPVEIRFIYVDPETMERRETGFRLEKT